MKVSQKYAKDLTNGIYKGVTGKPPRKKISKSVYQRDIDISHRVGEMTSFDILLARHHKGKYETLDDIIADMQLMLSETNSDLINRLKIKIASLSLEKVLDDYGYYSKETTISTDTISPSSINQSNGVQNATLPQA